MKPIRFASLVLLLGVTAVYSLNRPKFLVGDGPEYVAMMVSWATTARPYADPQVDGAFNRASSESGYGLSMQQLREHPGVAPFKDPKGNYDFPHFWAYSLLAAIPYKLYNSFTSQPFWAFVIVHLLLASGVIAVAKRYHGWEGVLAFLLLWVFSPVLWSGAHIHTEFYIFSLTTASVIFVSRRELMGAAICLAAASAQNPVFLPASLLLVAWYFVCLWRCGVQHHQLVLLASCAAIAVAHPLYYTLRLGVVSPQFLLKAVSLETRDLNYVLLPLTDLNVGLLANWPLGFLLLLAAPLIVSIDQIRRHSAPLAIYAVLVLFGASKTLNFNSGGSVYFSRYAIWLLCLFYPLLLGLVRRASNWEPNSGLTWRKYAYGVLAVAMVLAGVANVRQFWPGRAPTNTATAIARFVLDEVPALYDPIPEVFIERHVMEAEVSLDNWICGTRNGRKLLVRPSAMPRGIADLDRIPGVGWQIDARRLKELVDGRTRKDSRLLRQRHFYINVTAKEAADLLSCPALHSGQTITGTIADDIYFPAGWHQPEDWGRWSNQRSAMVHFTWAGSTSPNMLALSYDCFVPDKGSGVVAEIHLNGAKLWSGALVEAGEIAVPLDGVVMAKGSTNRLTCVTDPIRSPDLAIGIADGRALGLGLRYLRLE